MNLRRIEDEDLNLETWAELYKSSENLTSLVIHGCHLKNFGKEGSKLENISFPKLVDLNLSSNFLFDIRSNIIGFKCMNRTLIKLDLSSNRIRGDCFNNINLQFHSLKHLYIPYNAISSLIGLEDVCPKLEILDARSNRLQGNDTLNVLCKLPMIQTVDLHLRDVDHPTAFGIVGTLCNYDGHSIDDSDAEELPLLKSILLHKTSHKIHTSPNNQRGQAEVPVPNISIPPNTSQNQSKQSGEITAPSSSNSLSTPRFDQLAQQRRKAEEDKAKEKEMLADQRIRELESRLDALSAASHGLDVNGGNSFSDDQGAAGNKGRRRNFLKQPIVRLAPESPDRGPITREDDDEAYGFPSQSYQSSYRSPSSRNDREDDFPLTYPASSRASRGIEQNSLSDSDVDRIWHTERSQSQEARGGIRTDRLQRLRSSPKSSRVQGGETVLHEVVNGSVKLMSRSKHSKSVAWDKHSSRSPRNIKSPRAKQDRTHDRTQVREVNGGAVEETPIPDKTFQDDSGSVIENGLDSEDNAVSIRDKQSEKQSEKESEKESMLKNCHLIGSFLGRRIIFTKLQYFHKWHKQSHLKTAQNKLSHLIASSEMEMSKTKLEYENIIKNMKNEKDMLIEENKMKDMNNENMLKEMNLKLLESHHKITKCEKSLELANMQVIEVEDGVSKLVQAESRVAVLKVRAEIESSYAEQLSSIRNEYSSRESELRKQIKSAQESLTSAEEQQMNMKLKLKSTSQVLESTEEKLSLVKKEMSEKDKKHASELEMAAQRTEEALKTLQSRANAKVSELQRAFSEVAHGAAESKQRAALAVAREKQLTETVGELSSLARDQRDSLKALRKKLSYYESKSSETRMMEEEGKVQRSLKEQELEKEYKEMIHSLEARVVEAESAIMTSHENMLKAQEIQQEMEDKYNALLQEMEQKSNDETHDQLIAKYDVQHVLLVDSQNLNEKLKAKNESLELDMIKLENDKHELNQLYEDEKCELEEEIKLLSKENDHLQNRIDDQEEIENHLRDIINELRLQQSKKHSEYSQHQDDDKLDIDKMDKNERVAESQTSSQNQGTSEKDENKSSTVAALRNLVLEKDKALQFIEGELLGMKEVFETREQQLLTSLNNEKIKHETSNNEHVNKYNKLLSQYSTLEKDKFKLDEDYHTSRKKINELINNLDEAEAELTQLKRLKLQAESEAIRFQNALNAVNNALYSSTQSQQVRTTHGQSELFPSNQHHASGFSQHRSTMPQASFEQHAEIQYSSTNTNAPHMHPPQAYSLQRRTHEQGHST